MSTSMALISLEDLDGLDDDHMSDDITDEATEDIERQRLLNHWQAVGQTHHVAVPTEKLYEQSISKAFMKLMRFICKENSAGCYLGMTIPIVNSIDMVEASSTFEKDVLTAYYLPSEFQDNPPQPADPEVTIIFRPPFRVLARVFSGTTTEETVSQQIVQLWDHLGPSGDFRRDHYMVAVYENPGVPLRRNEIWFIHREP
ncbi:hypothetical protein CRUP_019640 [Coryphaenoides rupestris]|nr:hypothetical protein CRUP_019640 [Coryphaenoides rupestris]